jgi:carboxymethylenebutenolidase
MSRTSEIVASSESIVCDDGFRMPALLFARQDRAPRPGLLFISEPFGLNAEIQRVASEFAAAGYAVLAPDLFRRGSWFACVRALMSDLRKGGGRGVDDLLAARAWLGLHPAVEADRIAVMGLCMGGGFALILAKTGLFRVSAPFYGQTPRDMTGACPIVASFGGRDRIVRSHASHLASEVERIDVAHDIRIYEDAGHSFMTRPPNLGLALLGPILPAHAAYNPSASADATNRVLDFLSRHV